MKQGILLALAAVLAVAGADLDTVKAEPNPEKRARLAMVHASEQLDTARKVYNAGDTKAAVAALAELGASVDLCHESLHATGKDARKNPKAFKRAEMDIRELLRRLNSAETDFSVDDRQPIMDVERHLHEVHDDLIQQIMTKKK
jgi:hypothetical protein